MSGELDYLCIFSIIGWLVIPHSSTLHPSNNKYRAGSMTFPSWKIFRSKLSVGSSRKGKTEGREGDNARSLVEFAVSGT